MTGTVHPVVVISTAGPIPAEWAGRSPFAGLDVCAAAGWEVAAGRPRPCFDEDLWDLSGVLEFPKSARTNVRRMDFTAIMAPALRLTAKEYMFALIAPDHELVFALPHARRSPYKPASAFNITQQVVRWMNFVSEQGLGSLAEVLQEHCDVYREVRSERTRTSRGTGPIMSGTMLTILQPVQGMADYRDVFSVDAYRPGFTPWDGHTVSEVTGWKDRELGSTPSVAEEVFQPTVAAALYLVEALGPLVAVEFEALLQIRESTVSQKPRVITARHRTVLATIVDRRYLRKQVPLPQCEDRLVTRRLTRGWTPGDPLLRLDIGRLLGEATNYTGLADRLVDDLRPLLEPAVAKVGLAGTFGRDAAPIPRADDAQTSVPWTLPLTGDTLRGHVLVVMAACRTLVAALSGMRASELDELTGDSPLPPVTVSGETQRFRLASRLIKGQALRGVEEQWVVLEPAYRAVQLAARLNRAQADEPVFVRSPMGFLHQRLRGWVNGPEGQRLGLAPIPAGPVNGRMLRKTLSLELAHRPGGLLAAKIQLKHISVVTTEGGYVNRPGGAQATLLADIERAQADHHLQLTAQAFEDFRAGRMPAGPGARELVRVFERIDSQLNDHDAGAAAVLDNERRLENLLRQQSKSLHLQAANYCWFRDPSRALCLKLARTPTATKPLAGMCDSALCPQATHHPCHLPVWQGKADTGKVFLENPRFPKGEKIRLMPEIERAQRVVNEIIAARTASGQE